MSQAFTSLSELSSQVSVYCDNPNGYNTWQYGSIDAWDVSQLTSMADLFRYESTCNADISSWDVSKVTDFNEMFRGAKAFNVDISSWDVSKGKEFYYMFNQASDFNIDISSWDVSNGTNFGAMFFLAESFNVDISSWDVSKGTNFVHMFHGASSFDHELTTWPSKSQNNIYCISCNANHNLVDYGVDAHLTDNAPLQQCEGDCDMDSHCANGLICFQRNGFTSVSGCNGQGVWDFDYCTLP